MSYHYAFKKILGVPKYFSNHFICDIFSALTYTHLINFKCIRFLFWLDNCNSSCFSVFKYYFRNFTLLQCFDYLVFKKYGILNVYENDLDAVKSRFFNVQDREPRSRYYSVYHENVPQYC